MRRRACRTKKRDKTRIGAVGELWRTAPIPTFSTDDADLFVCMCKNFQLAADELENGFKTHPKPNKQMKTTYSHKTFFLFLVCFLCGGCSSGIEKNNTAATAKDGDFLYFFKGSDWTAPNYPFEDIVKSTNDPWLKANLAPVKIVADINNTTHFEVDGKKIHVGEGLDVRYFIALKTKAAPLYIGIGDNRRGLNRELLLVRETETAYWGSKVSYSRQENHHEWIRRGFVFKKNQTPIEEFGIILPDDPSCQLSYTPKQSESYAPHQKLGVNTGKFQNVALTPAFLASFPLLVLDSNYVVILPSLALVKEKKARVLWFKISDEGYFVPQGQLESGGK
jgi:hypothetical protein